MTDNQVEIAVYSIRAALNIQRPDDALTIIRALHPADRAEVFSVLEDEEQAQLLPLLDISLTADPFDELEDDDVLPQPQYTGAHI